MYKFANVDLLRKYPIFGGLTLCQILSIKTLIIINYTYSKEIEIIELSIPCFAHVTNLECF